MRTAVAIEPKTEPAPPPEQLRVRPARRRRKALLTVVAGVTAIAALSTSGSWLPSGGRSGGPAPEASLAPAPPTPEEALQLAAAGFLADWVEPDGRVVRRDQGGDTVSEGQAYGMLIALGAGDVERFDAIWSWTQQNLLLPNGLLAWRWADGVVADAGPASDADLDAARALVQAGTVFGRPDLTEAGNVLAGRIMDQLTVTTPSGRILLPGFWAAEGPDHAYNPSYASPAAFRLLAASTGDPRWEELRLGSLAVTLDLVADGALPPDWAQVKADGSVTPMPGPAGLGPSVRYSYDAVRLPLRFAEACGADEVGVAAALAPALDRLDPLPATLDLGGTALESDQNAVAYVARAAARAADGDESGSREDLQRADDLNALYPGYYGTAWAALGRIALDSTTLGGCAP